MFRCTRCGKSINSYSAPDNCPHCGVWFSGVKCDGCGYTGSKTEFYGSRCPKCNHHVYIPRTSQYQYQSPSKPMTKSEKIGTGLILGSLLLIIIGYVVFQDKKDKANKENNRLKLQATIEWVSIPAGTFEMGSPAGEVDRDADETQHQVTLSEFKMSKYEVTFEQYDLFCNVTGRNKPNDEGWGRGNRPVVNVSWSDANDFAEWIGCRLPSEAEWEYACRAGTITPFNAGRNLTTAQANYNGNYPYNNNPKGIYQEKTIPIGSFVPNAWGLYDMHGNVLEWCSDWYGNYSTEAQTDPKGPESGIYRVFRGGSWYDYTRYCRSACRNSNGPAYRRSFMGFRLALSQVNSVKSNTSF
jgi:sulfatase modifying factor 1